MFVLPIAPTIALINSWLSPSLRRCASTSVAIADLSPVVREYPVLSATTC